MLIRPRSAPETRLTSLLAFTIYARDDWAYADAAKMASETEASMPRSARSRARMAFNASPPSRPRQ